MMFILIVLQGILPSASTGLLNDAEIIKSVLTGHNIQIIDKNTIIKGIVFDFIIMLEHIFFNVIETTKYKKIIFIPNLEMLFDWDIKNIEKVDIIVAKTKLVKPFFEDLDIKVPKIVYTKFTSRCSNSSDIKKNKNLIIHLGGTSFMKNTTSVIKTWIDNDYFLKENPNIILVITKKSWHTTPIEKEGSKLWKSLKPVEVNIILDRKIKARKVRNIYLVEHFEKDDYEFFTNTAFMFLCPSLMEGYGHYINEGRCKEALVLTTDAPPMNELITDKKQLIKVDTKVLHTKDHSNKWIYKSDYVSNRVCIKDFGNKIRHYLGADIDNNIKNQNTNFINDTQFFNNHFLQIITNSD